MRDRYLALLRGINVGGKNVIRMADLAASFESLGLDSVATYIQTRNVVFRSEAGATALTERIEHMLSARFDYDATVTLRSRAQLGDVIAKAPDGFGTQPDAYRYDVAFLLEPLTPDEAIASVALREGVDQAHAGPGALYLSRLIERASQSRLSKLASTSAYQRMTLRNWRTTTRLLQLMDD